MTRFAYTNVTVFDGKGNSTPAQIIIWEGDKIVYTGPGEGVPLGEFAIAADGGTVLPGLIDAHVHISLDPVMTGISDIADEPLARSAMRAAKNASALLDAGITSARDLGSRDGVAIDVAQAQEAGEIRAARIVAAGRGITSIGGHGLTIGVEVEGPEAVAAAVRAEIDRGARVIKTFPTGGVLGPGAHGFEVVMTLGEMKAAIDTAHELGVKVTAHVHGPQGVQMVLDAGIDCIEHGTAMTEDQAARMAETGTALVPTLYPLAALQKAGDQVPADVRARAEEIKDVQSASVKTAIESGVVVLPGTDAGTPLNPVGNLVDEMLLLSALGLGDNGVITAATSQAATVLGLENLGVIESGATADLILVEGDPLEDLNLLRNPRAVVQGGVVYR